MVLTQVAPITAGSEPLQARELPPPRPAAGQLLLRVRACGVCHTELDEIEGRLAPAKLPRILGHQVVGEVLELGRGANRHAVGERVGVGWIASACGDCHYCRGSRENLCPQFRGTGYDIDGGYAEQMVVDEHFVHALPPDMPDQVAAPMLCAGAIGYRALRLAAVATDECLGLCGFGSSAQLLLPLLRQLYPDCLICVLARDPDARGRALAGGADWAGGFDEAPPRPLDVIIDTTPAWRPLLVALERLAPGGRLVVNAIRKEAADQALLQQLDYSTQLWREKSVKTVANVTRRDIREFLTLAAEHRIEPETESYPLAEANRALVALKTEPVRSARVLLP